MNSIRSNKLSLKYQMSTPSCIRLLRKNEFVAKTQFLFSAHPVNSSTLAMRSSLTMLSAFLVARSSLFSIIRFSTSLPIPTQSVKSYSENRKTVEFLSSSFFFLFFKSLRIIKIAIELFLEVSSAF